MLGARTHGAGALLAAVLMALLLAPQVRAWGDVGHKTVCEIAWNELSDTTKQSLRDLLEKDPQYGGYGDHAFAESCTWADLDAQKEARRADHFINVPRYYYEIRSAECRLPRRTDPIEAARRMDRHRADGLGRRVLRDRETAGGAVLRAGGHACWYDFDNRQWDKGEAMKKVVLDDAYLDANAEVVRQRLQQAGVRLGALLNRIFDPPNYE